MRKLWTLKGIIMHKRIVSYLAALLIGCYLVNAIPVFSSAMAESPPIPPPTNSNKAEEAIKRAKEHLLEAMKALSEAGQLMYQDRVPGVRDQLFSAMEHAQEMLQELQERFMSIPPPRSPKEHEEETPPTPEKELRSI